MTTSLEKMENEVQIHHSRNALSDSENIEKIGPVHPEIFDEICRTTT